MPSNPLKPCPFCGEVPTVEVLVNAGMEPDTGARYDTYYVGCTWCAESGTVGFDCDSEQDAIETWNFRADTDGTIAEDAELGRAYRWMSALPHDERDALIDQYQAGDDACSLTLRAYRNRTTR